jgi:hypothetical protein
LERLPVALAFDLPFVEAITSSPWLESNTLNKA